MIERVIQGEGKLPLKETFEHTAGGWVASDLLR